MKKLLIILLLIGTGYAQYRPRGVAKFCINQVFHEKQFAKMVELNKSKGCQNLMVTPIPETHYVHGYSVMVILGE